MKDVLKRTVLYKYEQLGWIDLKRSFTSGVCRREADDADMLHECVCVRHVNVFTRCCFEVNYDTFQVEPPRLGCSLFCYGLE